MIDAAMKINKISMASDDKMMAITEVILPATAFGVRQSLIAFDERYAPIIPRINDTNDVKNGRRIHNASEMIPRTSPPVSFALTPLPGAF